MHTLLSVFAGVRESMKTKKCVTCNAYIFFIATSNKSPTNVPIMNTITRIITPINIPIAVAAKYTNPPTKKTYNPKD